MSNTRIHGCHVFVCDECAEATLETEEQSWNAAWLAFREAGWKSKPDGQGGYLHSCEACVAAEAQI